VVEGARLESEYTAKPYRGFESLPLRQLAEIWTDKPETARRVRQRIGAVLDWAYSKGHRDSEAPMRSLSKGLPRQPKKDGHHAAMPFADVPAFLDSLAREGKLGTAGAGGCDPHCCPLRRDTRCKWSEVDLEKALWTVPAERMKAGKEHVVPLSPAALRVFQRAMSFAPKAARSSFMVPSATSR
jgi:integrase